MKSHLFIGNSHRKCISAGFLTQILTPFLRHCSTIKGDEADFPSTSVANSRPINRSQIPLERTRNFCIIAHIDHGKSTLADRLMELTGSIATSTVERPQLLDKLQVSVFVADSQLRSELEFDSINVYILYVRLSAIGA